jgi:hypothetical protein
MEVAFLEGDGFCLTRCEQVKVVVVNHYEKIVYVVTCMMQLESVRYD